MSLRSALLCVIGLLYAVSVPWYRTPGAPSSQLLGLPDWVTVALGCYVLAAILNALAWLLTDVRDEDPENRPG